MIDPASDTLEGHLGNAAPRLANDDCACLRLGDGTLVRCSGVFGCAEGERERTALHGERTEDA